MFVGRENELAGLGRLWDKGGFQMAVIYGRRRVGKTTLIDEFVRDKRTLYFTGQQQSSEMNLVAFSREVYRCFDIPVAAGPFPTWSAAFGFIASHIGTDQLAFVFDEFPYAAKTSPELPSALQASIDHGFLQTNVFLILCGSNEGFMESEVLGSKSPLYGRRTAQIHLTPFDHFDAAQMLPGRGPEELVMFYAAFGGTPYYLAQVDDGETFEQNIAHIMFDKMGLLYEEPLMLLRQELREPALYASILTAVSNGNTESSRIADASGVSQASVPKYLKTLEDLSLIKRSVPFGSNPSRSRGIYRVADPFFAFWYRFVSPATGAIERGAGEAAAHQACNNQVLATYVGKVFEDVSLQWVARQNQAGRLPFLATSFGTWWGTDPEARESVDIDLIAANQDEKVALFGECKWRNTFDETEAIETLVHRATLVHGFDRRIYALFSKRPLSAGTRAKLAADDDMLLVSAEDLF